MLLGMETEKFSNWPTKETFPPDGLLVDGVGEWGRGGGKGASILKNVSLTHSNP